MIGFLQVSVGVDGTGDNLLMRPGATLVSNSMGNYAGWGTLSGMLFNTDSKAWCSNAIPTGNFVVDFGEPVVYESLRYGWLASTDGGANYATSITVSGSNNNSTYYTLRSAFDPGHTVNTAPSLLPLYGVGQRLVSCTGSGAYRYWMIIPVAPTGSGYLGWMNPSEIRAYAASDGTGTNLCATASSAHIFYGDKSYTGGNAIDGNTGTIIEANFAGYSGSWANRVGRVLVKVDFGSAVTIGSFKLYDTAGSSSSSNIPTAVDIYASSDGTSWVTMARKKALASGLFSIP